MDRLLLGPLGLGFLRWLLGLAPLLLLGLLLVLLGRRLLLVLLLLGLLLVLLGRRLLLGWILLLWGLLLVLLRRWLLGRRLGRRLLWHRWLSGLWGLVYAVLDEEVLDLLLDPRFRLVIIVDEVVDVDPVDIVLLVLSEETLLHQGLDADVAVVPDRLTRGHRLGRADLLYRDIKGDNIALLGLLRCLEGKEPSRGVR